MEEYERAANHENIRQKTIKIDGAHLLPDAVSVLAWLLLLVVVVVVVVE